MDDVTIKYLIGHSPDSTVMETTYQHLTEEDHVQDAEVAAGLREPEDESPLTPDMCLTCGNQLEHDAKACPRCGAVFTPDAVEAREAIEADADDAKGEADTMDLLQAVDKIKRVQEENPELLEQLDL